MKAKLIGSLARNERDDMLGMLFEVDVNSIFRTVGGTFEIRRLGEATETHSNYTIPDSPQGH